MKSRTVINTWRVMGMWHDRREFLVVMGFSARDCQRRLDEALEEYDFFDLCCMECLWYETWDPGTDERAPEWVPVKEISLRRFRLLRA